MTETSHERKRWLHDSFGRLDDWSSWPDGIARLGVVLVAVVTLAFGIGEVPHALRQLGRHAARNASLSFADREIAGGNSILVDQIAAYQARALVPPGDTYRVVTGTGLKDPTSLTLPFVDSWFRYFMMPRRPAGSARWIVCYGCDTTALGGHFVESWHDDQGISIGKLDP